ncbi:hypothetical protein VKT23_003333 [Stygiomarasmius scandens]|uniref:Uncharacterized protein n=1 Tax=Marasmiellus scandens TaxID=2682957 RepID=A0ABR1JZ83_9AGAR
MDDVVVGEDDVVFCQSLVSVTRLQVDHVQCLRALLDCSKSNDAHCFPQLTFLRYRSLYISDWKELAALIDAFVPRYPPSLQIEVSGEGYDATEYSHFFDEKTRIQFSQLNDRQLLACFTDGYDSLDEGMWSSEESPDEFGYDDYEYDWDEYWEDEGFEDFDDDYEELEDVY